MRYPQMRHGYMWRLVFLTFFSGKLRASHDVAHHVHESPFSMTVPLMVLAALAIVGGALAWPPVLGGHEWLVEWLAPASTMSKLLSSPYWRSAGPPYRLEGGICREGGRGIAACDVRGARVGRRDIPVGVEGTDSHARGNARGRKTDARKSQAAGGRRMHHDATL